jgi:hypothetical protein
MLAQTNIFVKRGFLQITVIKYQISETMVQITVSKYQISETGVWTRVAAPPRLCGGTPL